MAAPCRQKIPQPCRRNWMPEPISGDRDHVGGHMLPYAGVACSHFPLCDGQVAEYGKR